MERIEKTTRLLLIFSILSLVFFVAGIPMIIIGAGKNTFLMIVGIVLTAADFYAAPILFSVYGAKKETRRLLFAVYREHLTALPDIAAQISKSEEATAALIRGAIEKCYLVGYSFDGKALRVNRRADPMEKEVLTECPSCGAKVRHREGEEVSCPYCGTLLH